MSRCIPHQKWGFSGLPFVRFGECLWTLGKHANYTYVFFTGGNSINKFHYTVVDFKLKDRKGNSLNATKEIRLVSANSSFDKMLFYICGNTCRDSGLDDLNPETNG